MALDSEAVFDALAARLSDELGSTVKSVSRRFRAQYVADELPAVIVADDEGSEDLTDDAADPGPLWRLSAEVWILARTVETDAAPTTQLNGLVLAVRNALERKAGDVPNPFGRMEFYTSLGGLVHSLSIQRIEKGSGALTGTAVAQLTITMEALG